jgi:hypothetical protein
MADQESDMTKQPILPYYAKTFKESDILSLRFIADATDSNGLAASKSKIRVPVTFRNTRTGAVYEAILSNAGDYKFTFRSDGTVFTAGVEGEWGYFQVPLGLEMKLGQRNPFNSRVLISPYNNAT